LRKRIFAIWAIAAAIVLVGCGNSKEENEALQRQLTGMWIEIETDETAFERDRYGRMVEFDVFEFTPDRKTAAHRVKDGSVSVYELNSYSVSKGIYKTVEKGVAVYAKIWISDDILHWETDGALARFRRFDESEMQQYGIEPYLPADGGD